MNTSEAIVVIDQIIQRIDLKDLNELSYLIEDLKDLVRELEVKYEEEAR